MVESTTANYGWTKPEVTKSASTWGGFLNGDLDSIDALVFANQQGIVPIGGIQMFGGAASPANWLLCDGTSYVRTAPYDKLFAVLSTRFGAVDGSHFSVPNLTQKFPLGAGPNPVGQTGGSLSATIAVGNLPAHNHSASQDAHNHGAWQDPHNHADTGHTHNASQDPHNHGGVMTPAAGYFSLASLNPQITAGRTDTQQPPVHISVASANLDSRTPNVYTDNRQPNVYIGNTGSGTPLSVVPPFVAVYFIVRYQ